MKTETVFDMATYLEVVEKLAAGYFNEDGEYQPHVGRINRMAVFADYCIKEGLPNESGDANVDALFSDKDFKEAFDLAVDDWANGLTFANACADAGAIVDYRKSYINQVASLVNGFVQKFFTPDNIAKLFENSERLKDIANADPDKITSLFGEVIK